MSKQSPSICSYSLEFKNFNRNMEEHHKIVEPAIENFWIKASKIFRQRDYSHNGCIITIEIDWRRIANRIRRDNDLLRQVRDGTSRDNKWFHKISRLSKIKAKAKTNNNNEISHHQWYPSFFLETFIHEFFLIANLSTPGSANFYSLSINSESESRTTEVRLSSFFFENGWIDSLDGGWPTLEILPIEDVREWFEAINIGYKQRASTGIEKALYVLLHMAKDETRIDSVIWIFNGLEALVSTRVGESVSGLVRRLGMILELDLPTQKKLNKELRSLYDLRSSFVHGGYAVPHPIHSEVIDRGLDDDALRLYQLHQFGASLLVSTIQALIKKRIVGLQFDDFMTTVKI